MMNDARYVFDTNVVISALLFPDSTPGKAVIQVVATGTILMSRPIIKEITEVLSRDKFDRYVTRDERERFLESMIRESELVEVTDEIEACRDPTDDRILELAVNGDASFIVTGDNDLLVLSPFRGIPILTPTELLTLFDVT